MSLGCGLLALLKELVSHQQIAMFNSPRQPLEGRVTSLQGFSDVRQLLDYSGVDDINHEVFIQSQPSFENSTVRSHPFRQYLSFNVEPQKPTNQSARNTQVPIAAARDLTGT